MRISIISKIAYMKFVAVCLVLQSLSVWAVNSGPSVTAVLEKSKLPREILEKNRHMIEFCEIDGELRDSCLSYLALLNRNAGFCEPIKGNIIFSECMTNLAVTTGSIEPCKQLTPYFRSKCYFQTVRESHKPGDCKEISADINEQGTCEAIATVSLKKCVSLSQPNPCYEQVLPMVRQTAECDQVSDAQVNSQCWRNVTKNPSEVVSLEPIAQTIATIVELLKTTKDANERLQIINRCNTLSCLLMVTNALNNPESCSLLGDRVKNFCLMIYRLLTDQKELCKDISRRDLRYYCQNLAFEPVAELKVDQAEVKKFYLNMNTDVPFSNLITMLRVGYPIDAVIDPEKIPPLHAAILNKFWDASIFLIRYGVRTDAVDLAGEDAFDAILRVCEMEAKSEMKAVALMLIKKGVPVGRKNKSGETLLVRAAHKDCTPIAEALISSGADVNEKSQKGETVLSIVSAKGNKRLVHLIKLHGG